MSRDSSGFRAPLSPPPTHLLCTSELPPVNWDATPACDGYPSHCEPSDAGPSRHATSDWAFAEKDYHSSPNQQFALHPHTSSSRGWSFEGTLSELTAGSVDPAVATLPLRGDSGFEESLPQHQSSPQSLPSLSVESASIFTKIEPTAFWAPHSPLSMHLELDDHAPHNPALLGTDYRHSSAFGISPSGSSRSQSTPTMSWSSHEWSSGSDRDDDFSPPSSPRPRSLSLDLPDLDSFSSQDSGLRVPDLPQGRPALLGLDGLDSRQQVPWLMQEDHHEDDGLRETYFMNIDGDPPEPSSPRPPLALLLPSGDDSADSFSDTVISPEEGPWSTSLSPTAYSDLRNTSNDPLCITPIPRPSLPTQAGAHSESPPSPAPLTFSLPSEEINPVETVAPSLLSPPAEGHEGLGLFLQPISVDPPLARSPSPDDDDLHFLEIQLDPTSTNLEVDEFLQLRAVRRRALAAERAARSAEAELAERVAAAAKALLPASQVTSSTGFDIDMDLVDAEDMFDDDAKRLRKHDLHVAMEMRAEARRARKREKQRSKEVGALLDLKMERGVAAGKGVMRSIAQLVANMVLRRRDTFRPLANRKTSTVRGPYVHTRLAFCLSSDDLNGLEREDTDADTDTDMDMDTDAAAMDVETLSDMEQDS